VAGLRCCGGIGWPISRNGWRLTEQPHLKFAKLIN
jgi:hypothetical protein